MTAFAWAVAINGSVGCGIDAQARSCKSGRKAWSGTIDAIAAGIVEGETADGISPLGGGKLSGGPHPKEGQRMGEKAPGGERALNQSWAARLCSLV